MNALELQGLTKHYKDFTLGPLDLTLPGGTICGLIGENGAGKSTTIRLILDMVQRDGGTVTILGRDSRTASVRSKEEIGVVLGSDGIPLCLNAVEVGKVMAGIYRNWDAGDYTAFCRKFDLPPDKKYKDYSAGMQRKLCIAVALAHHPKHAAVLAEFAGLIIGQQGHGHHAHQKARIYNKEIGPIHDGNHACAHHDHGGHNDTFGIVPYLISIL